MKTTLQKIAYGGWPNCYRLSNGLVELVATTDVGPRLIRLGFPGESNEFREVPEHLGQVGGNQWRSYGGHRLWHAPEQKPRTYLPDNEPVQLEEQGELVRLVQPLEAATGIQKEIDLWVDPTHPHLKLTHRLSNRGLWPVELAPWALTVMAAGGVAIIPHPPRGPWPDFLLPSHQLVLWPYTDMSDPRWNWGEKYVLLRQDAQAKLPQKIGAHNLDGWVAYQRNGHLFLKLYSVDPQAAYPDRGCTVETFTNAVMLEVETLGPLVRLEPGASVEHVEDWFLFQDVPEPRNDSEVEAQVLPRLQQARKIVDAASGAW